MVAPFLGHVIFFCKSNGLAVGGRRFPKCGVGVTAVLNYGAFRWFVSGLGRVVRGCRVGDFGVSFWDGEEIL